MMLKEYDASVQMVLLVRPYQEGHKPKIMANQGTLCWILDFVDTLGKQALRHPHLSEYEPYIMLQKCFKHPIAY